ncbi:MAG: molybdopterin-dependent oxidoreductase [bacterium]
MNDGMRRRDFFKVLAAGGTVSLAVGACVDPPEKLIPYLLPPDNVEFVPGNPLDYATTCMECPAACGMVVQTREARAIKAEGNPDHPTNRGALCLRGQASLQTLYNPSRIPSAMERRGSEWTALGWEAAEKAVADKIAAIPERRGVLLLTGNAAGSRAKFLDRWLQAVGGSPKLVFDPLGQANVKAANEKTFSRAEVPEYRIAEADFLLNFGTEFLETWLSPVEQNSQFATMHSVNDSAGRKGKFVHVGPHVSLTGANADEWVPVAPGSERELALAMAKAVFTRNRRNFRGRAREQLAEFLKPYDFDRAAKATGVDKKRLADLAREFQRAGTSLALAGGNTLAGREGTATQVAVNLLNYVAGNIGKTVLFGASRQVEEASSYRELAEAVARMHSGEVKLLIVDGVNPLYHLPPALKFGDALAKVDTVVSLSSQWDETTRLAHLALPGQTFLERWGDAFPSKGVSSLVQPVMASVFPVKAAEDTLLAVAKGLGLKEFEETATYRDYLRAAWGEVQKTVGSGEDFELFWNRSLQKGGVFQQVDFSSSARLDSKALSEPPSAPRLAGEGLVLLPTVSLRHRDGRGATHPWLQEVPDPVSQVVWDSWADINPETAKKLAIRHGERIRLRSPYGELETVAYLHYGVHRDAIAISLGQGHTGSGRNADLVGVNVMDLLPSTFDRESGQFAFLSTRVKVQGTGKHGDLVQLDGSPRQGHREIIQTITLEQVAKGEAPPSGHGAGAHARPANMYRPIKEIPGYHDPYRWGMTVDVDRCTGCSACAVACYAENNVAVVGKTRVGLGREMSWLRLERFLEGQGDSYRTLIQPMFCQHCSNAGCEPVCPVFATYHTPEGLNAQVYNRCVGTRYCANNCPYKARRFNWFHYEVDSPLHMQLNPDISVRSKGVMEKCTFCVQRIQRARFKADGEGNMVRDGDVTPACVQTCPTKALVFGNLADPQSAVSKAAARGKGKKRVRQYEVLAELANEPAVTYLRKVVFNNVHEEA